MLGATATDILLSEIVPCDATSGSAVLSYQKLRDDLTIHALTTKDIEKIEKTLIDKMRNCPPSSETGSTAELMRLVAQSWRDDGQLKRADSDYRLLSAYMDGASATLLMEIAVLQDWAKLKVQMKDNAAAQRLARSQSTLALKSYSHHEFGSSLAVDSLHFEAAILYSIGEARQARSIDVKAATIEATSRECGGLCRWKPGHK
jgi:hypothetical protein